MRALTLNEMEFVAGGDGEGNVPSKPTGPEDNKFPITSGHKDPTQMGPGQFVGKTLDYILSFEFLGLLADDYPKALEQQKNPDIEVKNLWLQGKVGVDNNGDWHDPTVMPTNTN